MSISRKDFVALCSNAIVYTRKELTVCNQVSGYKRFHREVKENKYYFKRVRTLLESTNDNDYMYRHDLVLHVGLGRCSELADFLLVEIGKEIDLRKARARINVISSKKSDHVYLDIKIKLEGEKGYSHWEVDAWDPRVIDVSVRPDGSIKNREVLRYGYDVEQEFTVFTNEIDYNQRYSFFNIIQKPKEGKPERGATPERDMLKIHSRLYSDYSIDKAMEEGKILAQDDDDLHFLQRSSRWQI